MVTTAASSGTSVGKMLKGETSKEDPIIMLQSALGIFLAVLRKFFGRFSPKNTTVGLIGTFSSFSSHLSQYKIVACLTCFLNSLIGYFSFHSGHSAPKRLPCAATIFSLGIPALYSKQSIFCVM